MDIRLVVKAGPDAGQEFRLRRGTLTLGRSPDNSIVLSDAKVSRWHAEIRWQDGVFVIRDLGSRNGTFVNDVRLTDPQVLRPGDRIRLGDTHLVVQEERKRVRPSDWVRRGRRGYRVWKEIQEERERAESVPREGQPRAERPPGPRPVQPLGGASPLLTTGLTLPLLITAVVTMLVISLAIALGRSVEPVVTPTLAPTLIFIEVTSTPTPTRARTPTPTQTPIPIPTATRTPTRILTPTPTQTPTHTPTGTRTPRPTWTPTPTRTRTPTPTETRTPTPTGTRTPTPIPPAVTPTNTPSPTPFVSFYADPNAVVLCGCTRVYWDVENVREVHFQGRGVAGHASEEVCTGHPGTTTYQLQVVYHDGSSQTFTADVVGMDEPATSLRDSVWEMLVSYDYNCQYESYYCPDEVLIWNPGFDPYRCVSEQAIPRIVEEDVGYTKTTVQEISTSELRNVLITSLSAGAVPSVAILAYPPATIKGLGDVIDAWPYYQWVYSWDQPSNALELLQYRTPTPFPPPAAPSGLSYKRIGCSTIAVTWQDNANNENGYRVYRDGSPITTLGPDATSFTDTDASAAKYTYGIAAFNAGGQSATLTITVPETIC